MGCFGLSEMNWKGGYRGNGLWGRVREKDALNSSNKQGQLALCQYDAICLQQSNVISRIKHSVVRAILPTELQRLTFRISESYKEYHPIAYPEKIPPKTKGSTENADIDTTLRRSLSTFPQRKKENKSGKGKQNTNKLETISEADYDRGRATYNNHKKNRQKTHISHPVVPGADEGNWCYNQEETDEDDSFDPTIHTPSHISSSNDEDSDNEVEGTNVEGAKSDKDATYEEDQGNEAVEDTIQS
ncbi:hypothetical protein Tco_1457928 [Tanacetum coccineum]